MRPQLARGACREAGEIGMIRDPELQPRDAMATGNLSNIDYWQQYGDYVLMAMPYADQVLVEGRGCLLRDADGKQLLDLASGMFCCVLGHNHPKFIQRITRQAEEL